MILEFSQDLVNISPGQEEKLDIKVYLHLTKDLLDRERVLKVVREGAEARIELCFVLDRIAVVLKT